MQFRADLDDGPNRGNEFGAKGSQGILDAWRRRRQQARESTPRSSRSLSRLLSTLAEITGMARRSSEKRLRTSHRFQMISGVQTPPSRLMQAAIGQPGGGGTFFLSFKGMTFTCAPICNLVS